MHVDCLSAIFNPACISRTEADPEAACGLQIVNKKSIITNNQRINVANRY